MQSKEGKVYSKLIRNKGGLQRPFSDLRGRRIQAAGPCAVSMPIISGDALIMPI